MHKLIRTATIMLVGLAATAGTAHAFPVDYSFDIGAVSKGGKGSFHVVLREYNPQSFGVISVQANPAGGGSLQVGGTSVPNSDEDRLTLTFYDQQNLNGNGVDVVGTNPGTVAGTNAAHTNWGAGAQGGVSYTFAFNGPLATAVKGNGSNVLEMG